MAVWHYMPRRGITESLEWDTNVQRCRSAEYRWSLRTKPRQEYQCRYLLSPSQFAGAKTAAKALGASSFFVPLWPWSWISAGIAQGATVVSKDASDPSDLTKATTSILIWETNSKYEVHTVSINGTSTITMGEATSVAFTRPIIVPLRTGQFAQGFEDTRSSYQSVECEARFRIIAGDDYSAESGALYVSETYSSHPVVTDRPLSGSGIRETHERRYEEVDSVIGQAYRYPTLSRPEQSGQLAWNAQTRDDMRALFYWIHSRKGQWKSFWVPSWNADLTVTAEIASDATTIEIADIGMRTNASFPLDIMVATTVGTRIYCHVTGATAGSAGKEVLALSGAFGTHLYTWEVSLACILTLSRFSSDRIEIEHGSANQVSVSAPIAEVPA